MKKREIVDEIYHINRLLQSLSDKYVFLNKKEEEYSFRFYTINALNKIVSMLRDIVLSKNISVEEHAYFSREIIKDLIKIIEYSEKTHDMVIINKEKCCILKDNKKYRTKLNEIFNKISTVIYEILDCNYITFDDVLNYIDNVVGGVDTIYNNYYNNLVLNGFRALKNLYGSNNKYDRKTIVLRCLFDEIARELRRDIKTKKSSTFYVFFGQPDFLYVD